MAYMPLVVGDDLPRAALVPAPLSSSVVLPSCTIRFCEKSSGATSPRFSSQSRISWSSSSPMMMRASEPPIKARRSWLMTEWGTSATLGVPGPSVAAGRISDAHFAAECPSYLEQN
jgi:hypothetical protein